MNGESKFYDYYVDICVDIPIRIDSNRCLKVDGSYMIKSLCSLSRALWHKIGSVIQMTFSLITEEQLGQMTWN